MGTEKYERSYDGELFLDELNRISRGLPRIKGRPERETIIQQDEVTNLRITLGMTDSVDAFLEAV